MHRADQHYLFIGLTTRRIDARISSDLSSWLPCAREEAGGLPCVLSNSKCALAVNQGLIYGVPMQSD